MLNDLAVDRGLSVGPRLSHLGFLQIRPQRATIVTPISEEAVMQAVPRWKYEPGLVGGKPVVWTNITEVIFELEP